MKRKTLLLTSSIILLTILLAVFNYACKKDIMVNTENEEQAVLNAPYWVCEGVLHFSSADSYFNLVDSLIQLDYKEFRQWEKSIGFSSFWSEQHAILERVEKVSKEDDYYWIAAENPNLVYIRDNEMELVDIGSNYRLVGNIDGIFCINDMYHRAFPQVLEVTQAEDLKSALLNFNTNKDVVSHQIQVETIDLKAQGCGTHYITDEKDNGQNYLNYRKVVAWLKIEIEIVHDDPCCVVYQQHVNMQIYGKKLNMWGQMYTYETVHYWQYLEVDFDRLSKSGTYQCTNIHGCTSPTCDLAIFLRGYTITVPDGHSPEMRIFDLRLHTGPRVHNDPISQTTKFHKARLKAWTRGTGSNVYAAICCNYVHCPF